MHSALAVVMNMCLDVACERLKLSNIFSLLQLDMLVTSNRGVVVALPVQLCVITMWFCYISSRTSSHGVLKSFHQ